MSDVGTIMVGVFSGFFMIFVIWVIIFRMTRKDINKMRDAVYSHNDVPLLGPDPGAYGMGPMPLDGSQRPPNQNPSAFMPPILPTAQMQPMTPQYSTPPQHLPNSYANLVPNPPPPPVPNPQYLAPTQPPPLYVNVVSGPQMDPQPQPDFPKPTAPPVEPAPNPATIATQPAPVDGAGPPVQTPTTAYHMMATPQFHTLSPGAFVHRTF